MIQTKENRNRMRTFIVLYFLGLSICQATEKDNSTQMYYVKLKIEESAIANITEILTPFVSNTSLNVDDLKITTKCQNVSAGTECVCMPNFRWSEVCLNSSQKCCSNKKCTFNSNSAHMCVSNTTVTINGVLTFSGSSYQDCLRDATSDEFKRCNNNLLQRMKTVYSTLTGFDTLTITGYRLGSIIADFVMVFANNVAQQDLINKSKSLSVNLSASISLKTRGVVVLSLPPASPVCYSHQPVLTCTTMEDLNTAPVWQLERDHIVYQIYNGTESDVMSETMKSTVTLKNISKHWTGEYTCVYHQKQEFNSITHRASGVLDISLLPDIDITTDPEFPHCKEGVDLVEVRAKCEIEKSSENYSVIWNGTNIFSGPVEVPGNVYEVKFIINCKSLNMPRLECIFKNRCNESRNASTNVDVINATDPFCAAEGDWKNTKADSTAQLKCTDKAGRRRRKCKGNGNAEATWEKEVSGCVDPNLDKVLQRSNIVDIGLGSVDENAANVFSIFEDITNDSDTINTFSNLNTAVKVLTSLSGKLKSIKNDSAVDDFLESSSNLLQKSLNQSWTTEADDESNTSLAERYLDSVEHLILMTDITRVHKKRNIEVVATNCTNLHQSQCIQKVFDVTVILGTQNHSNVKTAGFQELEHYLPQKDKRYKPNSIVVSTTTENQHHNNSFEIKIKFSLIEPRPPNVAIKCVAWDNKASAWSSDGCEWAGASDEGLCTCTHLSSFAILMSKSPQHIQGLEELTYVGLSISIVSLVISLVIELTVWSTVVKTSTSYLRHTAHVNISLCLLVADCCFLASSALPDVSDMWCKTFAVLKHFCYLSMFFWMLCLSSMLLHQAFFVFSNVSKKTYWKFSLVLGYVCPLLIAVITFLSYNGGAEGVYFSRKTCWLLYAGLMQGSIHTFVMPVGIIVIFNVFSMVMVIMKLLDHPMNTPVSNVKEKHAAVTVMRSVLLLTPIFGVTWMFGFAVMFIDLTAGTVAEVVHYVFTLLNAFQGLFILITTCLGDKLTREALLKCLKKKPPASTTDSTIKSESTWK